jgi:hypothetical protein
LGKYFPKGGTVATHEAAACDAKKRTADAATTTAAPEVTAPAATTTATAMTQIIGRKLIKKFLVGKTTKNFTGTVASYNAEDKSHTVMHEDGDHEDISDADLRPLLVKVATDNPTKKKVKTNRPPANLDLRNGFELPGPPKTNRPPTNAEPAAIAHPQLDLTNELPKQKAKKNVGKPRASKRKATANCSDTTRKSARTESSASWPSELGALVGLSTGHGSRRPLSACCVCGETCETVYKCNGCGLDLHVVCGLKDERPGSTSSQAWCQKWQRYEKVPPPWQVPRFFVPF